NSEAHNVDTENEAKRYYLDGEEGTVCVKDSNKCYKGIDTRNNLQPSTQVAAVFCLQNNDSSLKLDRENPLISLLNQRGIGEVLAENNKEDTVGYIIDPQTGMISDIDPGSYLIEYNNEHYAFEIRDYELENNEGSVLIYIDKDDNGEYNSETDLKISDIASEISVIALNAEHKYSLTEGFNFVSFPFLVSGAEYRTAAGLLKKLNEVYNNSLYSISKFDGGQWKIVGENVQLYDNNDFQLLPGVGYMIKAKRDINISILGQPVQFESESDTAPIYFSQGWNLISLYGTKVKSYTAKSLIEGINADNFKADNVTKWAKDKQMYEGFQLENKEEYGFDYPLNKLESYFVRITQGKGNWQPSLSGNN
ncbi:MAG: hypothetical protein WCX94_02095, partial [Candidatus Dojkabacteria bacterium]